MLRSEGESSSLNQYVPAGNTWPGISTGALNVTLVNLSHVSAYTCGASAAPIASRPKDNANFIFLILLFCYGSLLCWKAPVLANSAGFMSVRYFHGGKAYQRES